MKLILKHPRTFLKVLSFIMLLFILQLFLSLSVVYRTSMKEIEKSLNNLTVRIEKDLIYKNGKWDTHKYNADPFTPYPNGSSGFINPLYIITNEGFTIERSQPIKGLLDTSDFRHLIKFTVPQTIDTVTNEKWRIYSLPLINNDRTVGLIVVSYYISGDEIFSNGIDRKLQDNAKIIQSLITMKGNEISISNVDIRNIHYEFSFEVVDQYNNVLVNNGRVPTFIDKSYFSKAIGDKRVQVIRDTKTNEDFLIVSRVLRTEVQDVIGVVIAGQSIRAITKTVQNFALLTFLITVIFIVPLLFHMSRMLHPDIVELLSMGRDLKSIQVKDIFFDKKNSRITVDGNIFEIPYASNQFFICDALFSHPTKRWEYDQLLDKLGDIGDKLNTRKVYDATLAINKRIGIKLIEYQNKVFILNPEYTSKIRSKA